MNKENLLTQLKDFKSKYNEFETDQYNRELQAFLKGYDDSKYKKPSVTTDNVIFTIADAEEDDIKKVPEKEFKILLVKRKEHPFKGQWALPGGFLHTEESLDNCSERELFEETGVEGIYQEQLYTYGDVNRDPRTRVISCAYLSLVDSDKINLIAGDDAEDAKWFTIKENTILMEKEMLKNGYKQEKYILLELTSGVERILGLMKITKIAEGKQIRYEREIVDQYGISFDHTKVIQYGIERIRNKIEYTDIMFNLMPDLFTLTEIQKAYEVVLGKELVKPNFRRKMESKNMWIKVRESEKKVAHRTPALYRFNNEWEEF